MRQCKRIEDLKCSDSVKEASAQFVKRYMTFKLSKSTSSHGSSSRRSAEPSSRDVKRRKLDQSRKRRSDSKERSSSRVKSPEKQNEASSKSGSGKRGLEAQLRTVVVPSMVESKFLSVAQPNTSRNVETCAYLAGISSGPHLGGERFRVTHLMVPEQTGTSDSCTASNEEAIFEYQDKHGLITLGWIHTHPSQTAFLSSVDLHNHLSYQLMLPEALAIVCAPKYDETGYFMLTQNYGLDYIANCVQRGFHPHPKEGRLFEDAPHIQMDDSENVILVDLRCSPTSSSPKEHLQITEVAVVQDYDGDDAELPDITSEMEDEISAVLNFPSAVTLISAFGMDITRKDIDTLKGLNWLNDEIINFYLQMIVERSKGGGSMRRIN